jgi:hypothetical protein
MAEHVFDVLQFGRQSAVGTSVATTTLFPGKAPEPELDRGYQNPDEDYGRFSEEQPGRGSFGLRGGATSIDTEVRFEDFMHLLEMHLKGSVTPTGGPVYSWLYTADETSYSVKPYTIEMGSVDTAQDQYRLTGCVCDELAFGFDQLAAPGAQPWTATASILALNREVAALSVVAGTPTTAVQAPTTLETAFGHFSIIKEGATSVAFGSLSELSSHLIMFRATSKVPYVRRAYGGATDIAVGYGYSAKASVEFEAELKVSSSAKSNVVDIYDTAATAVQERRWRLVVAGSGSKALTTDMRVRFRTVGRGNRDGEATYLVAGSGVYDATLGGRIAVTSANGVATLP